MELDSPTRSLLKTFTARGMQADEVNAMAVAIGKVVQQIQARRGVDRDEALGMVADILGKAGTEEWDRFLRLPGESGTIDD
jgi:hypothetical protein